MKNKDNNMVGTVIGIIVLIVVVALLLWYFLRPKNDSNNNNLSSLVIANYPITFASDTTTYSIDIDEDVDSIEVKAVPDDKDAKVVITGNTNMKTGSNEIKITVTAVDGSSKVYTVHVNRKSNNDIINNNDLDMDNNDNNINDNNNNNNDTNNDNNNNRDNSNDVDNKINSIIYE